jgi:lipopolysaccharide export system protein LptA
VRFTIERIRTLMLVAGVLLMAALGLFLVKAKLKNMLGGRDLPQRLAKGIVQEANGYTFVHAFGAHSQYRIHASREVQLNNNRVELHEVQIELYDQGGNRIDQIAGDEFEYDEKSGQAFANGPVEMVLTQPANKKGANAKGATPGKSRQVHVRTSGVTFDRNTGVVTTEQLVNFSMMQADGSAIGAKYDSQSGHLALEQAVELTTRRGENPVAIHAQHAEIDRDTQLCWLSAARANYRGATADAAQAMILFREDGSADRLNATGGFKLVTATGGHVAAPTAWMNFDEHNQPRLGHLDGGVVMDSLKNGRTVHGTSPTAELTFTPQGQLRHAHLERGVSFASEEARVDASGQAAALRVSRTWRSPVADVDFREAGKGRVEPASIAGTGGVVITGETRRGDAVVAPSRMTADEVAGVFAADSKLQTMTGVGHAKMEQTTAAGAHQIATGDHLVTQFAPAGETTASVKTNAAAKDAGGPDASSAARATDVQSAEFDGHVSLFQQPAPKPGSQPRPPMHATAGKAVYEGTGQWLHLTINPRVEDGGMELAADTVDISQQSGDAFARGNVKGSWTANSTDTGAGLSGRQAPSQGGDTLTLGSKGPAHVIAAEAQLNESTGEATFRGHARLWQQANSVSGPMIVLNQHTQTLAARSTDPAEPVRAVLLSMGGPGIGKNAEHSQSQNTGGNAAAKPANPSLIRVRGGDLLYSDPERRAVMRAGALGAVIAETSTATSSSDAVDLRLLPAGNHEGNNGGQAQVDRMTATGHVVLTSQGRRGTGEQMEYSSVTGEYTLTGTAAVPPKMTDPERGTVTGEALIFHSRDDSVSIEGGGRETQTETTAPEAHRKLRQN